jgi:HSP20 family protein
MLSTWNGFTVFDRLLDDVMTGAGGTAQTARSFSPAIDVRANETEIVFTADVPGLKEKDLEITLHEGVLTIKGERKYEGNDKDKVLLGRAYGAFAKSYTLPDTVDPEKLSAELADGVLTVKVAQQPKREPKKIAITPVAK